MDVKKIKVTNKGLYYYQTEDFNSVKIKFIFDIDNTKKEILTAHILCSYLMRTNLEYESRMDIEKKCRELYSTDIYAFSGSEGVKRAIVFGLSFPSPRVIGDNYFKDVCDFFKTMITKPNFKNGKLKEDILEEIKNDISNGVRNNLSDPAFLQDSILNNIVFKDSDINNENFTTYEEFSEVLSSIKETDIINLYNKTMKNYICGYIFGNVEEADIKYLDECFDFTPIDFDYDYAKKEIIHEDNIEISNDMTTQSYLHVIYQIDDYDKNNYCLYSVLSNMLSCSIGPVYQVLRTELGIVYSASAGIYGNRGVLMIDAPIDHKNKEKALKGIDRIMEIMHDREYVQKLLDYIKERRHLTFYTSEESLLANVDEMEDYILKIQAPEDERLKIIDNISVDDIISEMDNLTRKIVFFFRGDKRE